MTDVVEKQLRRIGLTVSKPMLAIICIVFGLIVIVFRDYGVLEWVVGIFLIIQGILLLTEFMELQKQQPKT